jgi:cytochrome P450 family 12
VSVVIPNEYISKLEKNYLKANEFIPERWLTEKSDPLYHGHAHPMVSLPFGFGIRSCIGRRIAELEIETLVQNLLQNVKVEWTGPPLTITTKMINEFQKPFYFKITPIK